MQYIDTYVNNNLLNNVKYKINETIKLAIVFISNNSREKSIILFKNITFNLINR